VARRPTLPSASAIARPHLERAKADAEAAVAEHLRIVRTFFEDAKQRTPAFAERALGWSSKWRLVADSVPFTRGDRHREFLRSQFEQSLFRAQDLEALIDQVVRSYLIHLQSIEYQMLVAMRADLADGPAAYLLTDVDDRALQQSYDRALAAVVETTETSLAVDVSTEVISLIAGEVLAQVAVRLGVSAGILGGGASTSWATFGVGIGVGLIVDQLVTRVWEYLADPAGDLATELNIRFDAIRRMLIDGTGDTPGLEGTLLEFAQQRHQLRQRAVLSMLQARGASP
jgi:hypothetical protein